MNIEAFQNLIRVLEKVRDTPTLRSQFDLDWWYTTSTATSVPYEEQVALMENPPEELDLVTIPHVCGTTACAIGFAGLDSYFRRLGLKTDVRGTITFPDPNEEEVFRGVADFFDISYYQAEQLFSPEGYPDTAEADKYDRVIPIEEVITYVKAFVENNK